MLTLPSHDFMQYATRYSPSHHLTWPNEAGERATLVLAMAFSKWLSAWLFAMASSMLLSALVF